MTDPQPHTEPGVDPRMSVNAKWYWLVIMGVVMLIGGFLCLMNPFAASITVTAFASVAFAIVGVMMIVAAFRDDAETMGGRLLTGLGGVVFLFFALSLIAHPLKGLISLTFLAALLFIMTGAVQAGVAWRLRPNKPWGWMMFSGVISILLGFYIIVTLPASSVAILGLLLGIDLLSSGVAYVMLGLFVRRGGA